MYVYLCIYIYIYIYIHLLQFSVDLSEELLSKLEGHLQDPVSVESYAPQSTLTRDREPPLSKEAEEVPQGKLWCE